MKIIQEIGSTFLEFVENVPGFDPEESMELAKGHPAWVKEIIKSVEANYYYDSHSHATLYRIMEEMSAIGERPLEVTTDTQWDFESIMRDIVKRTVIGRDTHLNVFLSWSVTPEGRRAHFMDKALENNPPMSTWGIMVNSFIEYVWDVYQAFALVFQEVYLNKLVRTTTKKDEGKTTADVAMDRDAFMEFFRDEEKLNTLSVSDRKEVFSMILSGGSDFTKEFLDSILSDYQVDHLEIIDHSKEEKNG